MALLSEDCRECEAIAGGEDGAVETALHMLWKEAWYRSDERGRTPEFTLRFQEVKRLWVMQDGRCAMTGRPMDCRAKLDRARDPRAPSLDRIDSNGPYAPGNIQLVCWVVNRLKSDMSVGDLVDWCSAIVAHAAAANGDLVVANSNAPVDNQVA